MDSSELGIDLDTEHGPHRHDIDLDLLDSLNKTSKKQLLQQLLDAFVDYRKESRLPSHHILNLTATDLTYKILYGSFDLKAGFSGKPDWSKNYQRVKYYLDKYFSCTEDKYLITPNSEEKLLAYLEGTNDRDAQEEESPESEQPLGPEIQKKVDLYLSLDFDDYVSEEQVIIYRCKICDLMLQHYEITPHMQNHTLADFLKVRESEEK